MADANPKSPPISILYVDDEPALLETCRLYLQEYNDLTVTTCQSAVEAIDLLRMRSFDAIVADYDMPDMDGIALLKHLRKEGNTTPFIIFTGKGCEEVVIEALNCGADFYIQKIGEPSFIFHDLFRKVTYAVARMRSEIALNESEEWYRAVVETQSELICRFLPDGTHLFVNDAYCRYFGLDREVIIGNRFMPVIYPADRDRVKGFLFSLTKENPVGSIDQRIIMPDNKVLWQRWNTRAIFDEDGQIIEYQSVGRDITSEKETQEKLSANAERAKRQRKAIADLALDDAILSGDMKTALTKITKIVSETLETRRVGIWTFSKDGSRLQCLSLYDADEKRQNNGITLKTDEYPRYFDTLRRKHRLCVEDISSDSRISELKEGYLDPLGISAMLDVAILKDGSLIGILCLEEMGAPRRWHADEEGFANIAASIIAQLFESAERRQAEEALVESEERFRSLAEHAIDIIYRIDLMPEIHFTYVNPVIEEVSGYAPQDFYDDPGLATRIVHPDDRPLLESFLSAESSGIPCRLRWIRKDGEVIWIEQRIVPIHDKEGARIAIEGIVRDITEIRQAEQEALLETDTRYRSLFSSMHDGYARLQLTRDFDGKPSDLRIIELNLTMEMITGLSAEKAIGRTLLEALPDLEPAWRERLHTTADSGEPQVVEYHHPGLDSDYEVLVYSPKSHS